MDSLKLKATIDSDSGFCFGVVYAIEMAEEILEQDGYLYCLGDIVHNDEEVQRLTKKGLRIIQHKDLETIHNEKVLIRAHGEAPETYKKALLQNIMLIDASCPVVLKLQNRVKEASDNQENIVIYGKHGHAEVIGLQGQTNGASIVFQNIEELKVLNLPDTLTIFSQTTKDTQNFYNIVSYLKERYKEVKVNDTICRQVSNRDKELRNFVKNYDKIVFVSGQKSSNGKVLFEICKSENPNTLFISSASELAPQQFSKNDSVGICGATSTPMWLMEEIKTQLLSF